MFNVNKFLTRSQKIILEQQFKSYLYDSVNKHSKLMAKINEDTKRKNEIQEILYGNKYALIKTKSSNHYVNDLINKSKMNSFFLIFSVVSIGALIFYKK